MTDLPEVPSSWNRQPKHGIARYRRGCRCDTCKAANAEQSTKRRRGRLQQIAPVNTNGVVGGRDHVIASDDGLYLS